MNNNHQYENYQYDFYTWYADIKCAEEIAKTMVECSIKNAIRYAIINNNYENYPDSDSNVSVTTDEFNEIHYDYDFYDKKNNTCEINNTCKKNNMCKKIKNLFQCFCKRRNALHKNGKK
jgi:hypothetical protein